MYFGHFYMNELVYLNIPIKLKLCIDDLSEGYMNKNGQGVLKRNILEKVIERVSQE